MSTDLKVHELELGSLERDVQLARLARQRGDLRQALSIWQSIVQRFPHHSVGWVEAGSLHRAVSQSKEAEALLATAEQEFDRDEQLLSQYALAAQRSRDFAAAERRWIRVVQNSPASIQGYVGLGVALREQKEFERAESMFIEGMTKFPSSPELELEWGLVPLMQGDVDKTLVRWRGLRAKHPQRMEIYDRLERLLEDHELFNEADDVCASGLEMFPNDINLLIKHARLAQRRGHLSEALSRWDNFATVNPMRPEGYQGGAKVLLQLGRFADAENCLVPAVRMFPDNEQILVLSSWVATRMNEVEEALTRWARVRSKFPGSAVGYTGGAVALSMAARLVDAKQLLLEAIERFPTDIDVHGGLVRIARMARDHMAAVDWARRTFDLFSESPRAYWTLGEALAAAQMHLEADQILASGIAKFPDSAEISAAYARNAAALGDNVESGARWSQHCARFPKNSAGHAGRGQLLREMGSFDEATRALEDGIGQFPFDFELKRQLALTMSAQRRWAEVLPLWVELKQRHALRVKADLMQVLWQARQDLGAGSVEDTAASRPSVSIPAFLLEGEPEHANDDLKGLMMKFESIGDTCEFGIVQRRFGAEPLGLLRWANTTPPVLAQAVRDRLDGVGDPEHTELLVRNGYYDTRDRRYVMLSHTFTSAALEPQERFFKQQCKRMQYLRRKLIDDVTVGEKIFVYKYLRGITEAEAKDLHLAMGTYGGNPALLCVRQQDESHAVGSIAVLDERLFMGYIDKFSTVDISVDVWIKLCRTVDALLRQ